MCGLIASTSLYTFGGNEALDRGVACLMSRGPDAGGVAVRDSFAVGHRRLTIIGDSEFGAQPVTSKPGSVLVYNGEIYNYAGLAADLRIEAHSDTDVLYEIASLGRWDLLNRLRGMFAFVHIDAERRVVTAARDPYGIKPLYALKHSDGAWSFASTVAALSASREVLAVDSVAIAGFLAEGLMPSGKSPFAQIEKLAPGEVLQLRWVGHGWAARRWQLNPHEWRAAPVEDAIRDSVRAHLVSDVEVGVLLSGGVDSTLLATIASKEVSHLKTFTLVNPVDPTIDESRFARHNSRLMGAGHIEVPVDPRSLVEFVEPLIRSSGEPFADAAYLPLAALSQEISRHVKTALAGEGADELFGGYRRYDLERWLDKRAVRNTIAAAFRSMPGTSPAEKTHHVLRALQASAFSDAADRHADLMFARWPAVIAIFGEAAAEAKENFHCRWEQASGDVWAMGMPPNRAYDLREWLPNVFLEKSDRASMLSSLELRTPYLDPVVGSSIRGFCPRNSRKRPLRGLLSELLPGVRLPKRKMGLNVNIPGVLSAGLHSLTRDVIHDPGSVLRQVGDFVPGDVERLATNDPAFAFRLATLGVWQSRFLGRG